MHWMDRVRLAVVTVSLLTVGLGRLAFAAATPVDIDRLAGVYLAQPADDVERQAAAELKTGLKKLYGIDLADAPEQNGQPMVLLGRKAAVQSKLLSAKELDAVRPQGYVLSCGNGRIAIAGGDRWGTLFGVYGFLEKLGARIYGSTLAAAYFRKPEKRAIEPFRLAETPAFAYRSGWDLARRETGRLLGDARKGLDPGLFVRKKTGSDLWIDHTAGYLVPKRLYYGKHPEYYAMGKDGKRVAKNAFTDHRTPLCLSNPDVTRISAERLLGLIEKNPLQQFFFVTYGDTGLWCQCPECLKLDPKPREYATRLLHWVNGVARVVAKKGLDKIILTFAYGGSGIVPPAVRPDKNVWVVVATGAGSVRFWDPALAQGQAHISKVQSWINAAPGQIMVCEYHGAYEPAMLEDNAARLRYYNKIGLQGIAFTYGAAPNFRELWRYLWGQLCWDPAQDPHVLANGYLRHAYGSAAEPLVRLFDLTGRQYRKVLADKDELIGLYPKNFYAPEFVGKAEKCFDDAIAAAGKNARLRAQMQTEYKLFLSDAARHLPAYDLSETANAQLLGLLGKARALARATNSDLDFLRETQRFTHELEKKTPGYRRVIETWLNASVDMQPLPIKNGIRFTPQMFRGCDYGPGPFPGGRAKSHPSAPGPPKVCAGVYMKAKGGHGQVTSSRMHVAFQLDSVPANRKAVLTVEAQDAISHWLPERGLGWKTDIEILVNGKAIFKGESGFVRGNWSRQSFDVPAGLLKRGENKIELHNVSRRGWFAGCWLLVSDVTLTFAAKVRE